MLTFDEPTHVYRWHGRPVPNVTRVIAPLCDYSMIPLATLERARQQGIAVHKMVELDCKNDLNVKTLPDWMHPHYTAWCRFRDETGFECWDAERRGYHQQLGVAGTLDLAGLVPKLPKIACGVLIDVKRSLFAGPAIGLQTVAYEEIRNAEVPKDLRTHLRFALELRADASYRLTPFTDPDDRVAFLACLQQLRWKEKHYERRP